MLTHARPLITNILGRCRRSEPLSSEDVEELESVVLLRVIAKLHATAVSSAAAIVQFHDYVAKLVYHTVYDVRRERFPERTRLKNRLRYVLTHDPRLALWRTENALLCGVAARRGTIEFQTSLPLSPERVTAEMRDASRPADALAVILTTAGVVIPFDILVGAVAELWEIRDARPAELPAALAATDDHLAALVERQSMEILWQEILLLPPSQRSALLLNLREGSGSNALSLLVLLGIAGIDDVAAATGLSAEELRSVWPSLPLDDLQIAERLGCSRQQVINLRKAARARLSRRMAAVRRP